MLQKALYLKSFNGEFVLATSPRFKFSCGIFADAKFDLHEKAGETVQM
jgi:hypothetical protein